MGATKKILSILAAAVIAIAFFIYVVADDESQMTEPPVKVDAIEQMAGVTDDYDGGQLDFLPEPDTSDSLLLVTTESFMPDEQESVDITDNIDATETERETEIITYDTSEPSSELPIDTDSTEIEPFTSNAQDNGDNNDDGDNPDIDEINLDSDTDDDTADITDESEITVDPKPLTPDGQATVTDLAYESDGKKFYTFKTPAGSLFYLVIDHQRNADNVYFLKSVTEDDLFALANNSDKNSKINTIPTPEPTTYPPQPDYTRDTPDRAEKPPSERENNNTLIFAIVGVIVLVGIIYYVKVVRPKRHAVTEGEDDDATDDGEEMKFEDEPEDNE